MVIGSEDSKFVHFRDLAKCTAECSCPEDSSLLGCYAISIGKYFQMVYRFIALDGFTVF